MKFLKIVPIILIVAIMAILVYRSTREVPVNIPESAQYQKINAVNEQIRTERDILFSESASREDRVEAVKTLKEISLDTTLDNEVRLRAGQPVTLSFFGYGMNVGEGFSQEPFVERDIFEYAKSLNTLGDSDRNSLLTAYIGLRFFSDEIDEKFVTDLLDSSKRQITEVGSASMCSVNSKTASIIYLAKKYKDIDLSDRYGDYYTLFQNAYTECASERMKTLIAFMWLGALSDIGESIEEKQKAKELVTLLTTNTASDAPFIVYLKDAYFAENKEPDTVSIIERLIAQYPEFRIFIESIK